MLLQWIRNRYASERGLVRYWLGQLESCLGRTREFEQVDLARAERLVFVCLGNICRSPFGEYVARREGIEAVGFGLSTTTGMPAFALGQETARDYGIDMSAHKTTDISDFDIKDSDLLLVMEVRHARRLKARLGGSKAQIALLGHWAKPRHLHIHDPHVHDKAYFSHCYGIIEQATERLCQQWKAARASRQS
ncbi:hypothetical protein P2G88_03485 [Aliiglaciecola sp. CAU 1673]|uniref:arsenate reductase/protein-tyrosine-phosphatase family protein n=1 Tax=Aliiglaciecola sp. CAU 1673 TaxID=3032595 RepID=UPI0023DA14AD|nr:hypothetical protein [Aliiglaciecola sp. CAU 1673]MDF2177305.1 hypothetical protein [Aliiglaciecola sp. CAU 1673]